MTRLRTDDLLRVLRLNPGAGSALLCAQLGGIDKSTLTRGLKTLGGQVVSRGGSRRTRYAARRALRGDAAPIPLFRVDASGQVHDAGQLDLVAPHGTALTVDAAFNWPLPDAMRDGWFEGLPYPLIDMRPQGFLGRNFARHHARDLGVADNPELWSDDDVLHVLAILGHDQPGDLIVGAGACRRYLDLLQGGTAGFLDEADIASAWPALAASALAQGDADSSAAGEFPKFTARRMRDGAPLNVIVKFSGVDDSAAVRRWADLLVCEHVALDTIRRELGIDAARGALLRHGGRTFLEVERFDRHGAFGRSPLCSLASLEAALIGKAGASWDQLALDLHRAGWLADAALEQIRVLWQFGRLIGNTDMHNGNLSFRPGSGLGPDARMTLAPVYDMLPMLYAPTRGGEVPERDLVLSLPLPAERPAWQRAARAARRYWHACAADARISADFRAVCADNAMRLDALQAD